jgi:hypothetical protein
MARATGAVHIYLKRVMTNSFNLVMCWFERRGIVQD